MTSHPFFTDFPIVELTPETFDAAVLAAPPGIVAVFFWGHDCPNCEVAKRMLHQDRDELRSLNFRWFHVNTYNHFDLGTRFGLFGIPTFMFWNAGKKLGRISPFPGTGPFFEALGKLRNSLAGPSSSERS